VFGYGLFHERNRVGAAGLRTDVEVRGAGTPPPKCV
jgi:hypothetical protein